MYKVSFIWKPRNLLLTFLCQNTFFTQSFQIRFHPIFRHQRIFGQHGVALGDIFLLTTEPFSKLGCQVCDTYYPTFRVRFFLS